MSNILNISVKILYEGQNHNNTKFLINILIGKFLQL